MRDESTCLLNLPWSIDRFKAHLSMNFKNIYLANFFLSATICDQMWNFARMLVERDLFGKICEEFLKF
jgi:hypothetical protein